MARITIEQMKKIAEKRGGECLSDEYQDSQTMLKWKCSYGHEWEAKPNNIKNGKWCPQCAIVNERRLRNLRVGVVFNNF